MTVEESTLSALARSTVEVYERCAERFDAERTKGLHERVWLDRFLALLPLGGSVLDLGCGTGDPIAAYLAGRGLRVTGADASHAMLRIARERCPGGDWQQADMRTLALPDRFDGILGWNSFFHLTPDEQRATLPRLAAHLKRCGALMLTVGPAACEVEGRTGGYAVYHSSLRPDEYEAILHGLGFRIVEFMSEDPGCNRQTVLLARLYGDVRTDSRSRSCDLFT